MIRAGAFCLLCLMGLTACGEQSAPYGLATQFERPQGKDQQAFAYNHTLGLGMARQYIDPRFARARDRCLQDAAMDCKLLSASLTTQDFSRYSYVTGQLVVTLPHNKIDAFEKSLLEPVPGESAGDVSVGSRSIAAENVKQEVEDVDRRLAQLNDYRDRLVALSKRADVRADELIKIEAELSKVQSDIEQLTAQKRDVGERVNRERLSVALGEHPTLADATRPIGRVWANGVQTLGDSTASALEFLIRAVPWLPVIAGGLFLLAWFWKFVRRRRAEKSAS